MQLLKRVERWGDPDRQLLVGALALTERSRAHAQADAITGFMHRTGENRSAQFRAAAMRGSAGNESAAQEAAEITGVR